MPEGDTIHRAARRVGEALVGREIVSIETPHPRHRPCARCGTRIRAGGLGADNRTAYWCPGCQS